MDTLGDIYKERLEEAMPWVGRYIAAASALCTLAMAADLFNGLQRKKLWFPCKYFSLNPTSLTLLSVAMKLPMDLATISVFKNADSLAKFSSLIFISTSMANFMSSLGSMNDKNILPNVVGLGILVITIAGDVLIQYILVPRSTPIFILFSMILMLLMLVMLVSLAITVSTTKRSLESVYQQRYKVALAKEEVLERREAFITDDQRRYMMKYWVMAETSSPQFVMARSVICTTSAVICLIALITFATVFILLFPTAYVLSSPRFQDLESPYSTSTKWILYVQSTGIAVGTIAPVLRWFVVVSFKYGSITNRNSFRKGFKIETYWIQSLVDWRDSFSALHIPQGKYRKCLHDVKWFAVTFCIGLQILIVLLSKLLVFLSVLLMNPFFVCFTHIKKLAMEPSFNVITSDQSRDDKDLNLSNYVLLLEGEGKLPRRVLKNICCEADNMIQRGRKKQPKNLVKLLGKFVDFSGVGQFDSNQIPSLNSEEPPMCWTLPVVTLTSIAIALPNTAKNNQKQLLSSVSQGLSLAKLVDKAHDKNAQQVNIRKAADICWVRVVLYTKWPEIDLRKISRKWKNSKQILQKLSDKAKEIITKFENDVQDPIMGAPPNWPANVVAANSMYRICRTILLSYEGKNEQSDDELFERLSVMIADILAACLTNLPHVITTMCHHNAIEKREKSVRKAFFLLGKTEKIVELLHQQEWPSMDHDKALSIEEWCALFSQNNGNSATVASTSSDETLKAPVPSSEEHLAIKVDS